MPPLGPTYFAIIDRALKSEVKNGIAIGIGIVTRELRLIFQKFKNFIYINSQTFTKPIRRKKRVKQPELRLSFTNLMP